MKALGSRLTALEAKIAARTGPVGSGQLAQALGLSPGAVATETARIKGVLHQQGYDAAVLALANEFRCSPADVLLTLARVEDAARRWCSWVSPDRHDRDPKGIEYVSVLAAITVAARGLAPTGSWALPLVRWQAMWTELSAARPDGLVDLAQLARRLAEREPFSEAVLRDALLEAAQTSCLLMHGTFVRGSLAGVLGIEQQAAGSESERSQASKQGAGT